MKILVIDPLDDEFFNILNGKAIIIKAYDCHQNLIELVRDVTVIVTRSSHKIDKAVIDNAKNLKIIARAGVGLDNIEVDYAVRHGITVISTPDASTRAVAELTIGFIIALARQMSSFDRFMHDGEWCKNSKFGVELVGKTLGIIGLGRIGSQVAKLARTFRMRVIAYDPYISPMKAEKLRVELKKNLDDLLIESDFVSVHASLTSETRGLIGEREFRLMKSTAFLINTARGAIIDENALIKALKEKWIAGAALDVYAEEPLPREHPLRKMENTILTPHIGGSTVEAQKKIARILAMKIMKTLEKLERVG
ncbi:hydroxyacid dehydrogenase [Candidatus Bathyarchaeota archaeon]|nr:hydroxyacid dehydrogenase [Candidatus Bathyarchaeota archaeon]MBS7618470.1 hydroxyacid dehydrogenase [Candidatus Bathyarchaeota archaeon]